MCQKFLAMGKPPQTQRAVSREYSILKATPAFPKSTRKNLSVPMTDKLDLILLDKLDLFLLENQFALMQQVLVRC